MRTISFSLLVGAVLISSTAAAQTTDTAPAEGAPPPAPAAEAPPPPPAPVNATGSVSGPAVASSNEWKMDYHGYFRAPMRMGFGHQDAQPTPATVASQTAPNAGYRSVGQSASTIHYPVVPDDQYLSWQYSGVESKDWAEMFFDYGNNVAKGTVSIQGYNLTDAAYQMGSAQFGIGMGWLTLNPRTGFQNVRLQAKVGSFWDKYGMAGKYDAGKYDTYLFARTHQMGETLRLELDIGKTTLWMEEGFGAKQPDPNQYNSAKFTLLAHAHAGLKWNRMLDISFHAMHSWAREEDRENLSTTWCAGSPATTPANPASYCANQYGQKLGGIGYNVGYSGLPDGSLSVVGADIALRNNIAGEFYAGFAHAGATNAWVVEEAMETIHSAGGGQFHQGVTSNYLEAGNVGSVASNPTLPTFTTGSHGTGRVDTFLMQYDFSVANLMSHLKHKGQFWGDGPDLTMSYFMMLNSVYSLDPMLGVAPGGVGVATGGHLTKLKFGFDVLGTPVKWLGLGFRFDDLMPNNANKQQNFMIASPRLVFKTAFVTHETVTLQYSRYMYSKRVCDSNADLASCVQPPPGSVQPNGFGNAGENNTPPSRGAPSKIPDENVINLSATMWW